MKISVRIATKSDMPTVYKFMQDLATSLNALTHLKVSVEDLYRDGGFDGGQPYFFAMLAEDSDQKDSDGLPIVVGCSLNSYLYSWDGRTIYIRNFVVEEAYRSKGIGRILYNGLCKHAKEVGCNRIEFDVLSRNERARKFYDDLGAINMTEQYGFLMYRVTKDGIEKAADFSAAMKSE